MTSAPSPAMEHDPLPRRWWGKGSVAIVGGTPSFEQRLHAVLVANGGPSIVRWPAANGEASSNGVSVAFVGPELPLDSLLAMAEAIDREHPEVCVVLVTEPSPSLLEKALRAGVRDLVSPHSSDRDLETVLDRALDAAHRRRVGAGTERANEEGYKRRIISILSPKGGVGKTTVSSNLAVAMATVLPNEVALVDLDLQFGDCASALRLMPEHTVADAARSSVASESTLVKVFMTPHDSSLLVMCAPEDPADADDVTYEQSAQLVRLLSGSFQTVIVDTAAGLDSHALAVAEISTDLVFVCSVDVASVRSLRKELDALDRLGMVGQRRHLILNRIDAPGGAKPEEVEVAIGLKASMAIPTDKIVLAAANQGTPLVRFDPKSPIVKKFLTLAESFSGVQRNANKPASLFAWRKTK